MTNQKQANSALKLITKTIESTATEVTLRALNLNFSNGKILSLNKWLQRLEKEQEWTKNNYKKAKSYIHSCITGVGTLQEYIIIKISKLIGLVREHCSKNIKPDDIYKDILESLEEMKLSGCKYICLDGQNRGKHAIIPFFNGTFVLNKVSAKKDGSDKDFDYYDTKFTKLPDEIKEQIKDIKVKLTEITWANSLKDVRDVVINKNEGIAWMPHEKRITSFTDVSYILNDLSLHPVIKGFYSKLEKHKVLNGDYKLDKKGDTFMLSEYLFYLCYNSFGSQSSLDTFFKDFPEENKVNFKKHKEIMLYLAEQYNKGYINLFGRKSLFDDIFMFFATLLNKDNYISVSLEKLGNKDEIILNPKDFFKVICKTLQDRINKKEDIDSKTKDFLPGTFGGRHKGKSAVNLKERLKIINQELIPVVVKFIKNETIIPFKNERQYIPVSTKLEVLRRQNNEFLGEPVVLAESELDHIVPVSKGGTNDPENLRYVPKKYNRDKSDRIV